MTTQTKSEKTFRAAQKIIGGLVCLAFILFVYTKLRPLFHGPSVNLPLSNYSTVTDPTIHLTGMAMYTKSLIVNGSPVALSPTGYFDEHIALSPGYNTITVAAQDRFGKKTLKTYAIVLNQPQTTAVNIPPFNNQN